MIYVFVEVCDNMIYGLGCVLFCGKCSNGEICYFVDGLCFYGCVEGVIGDKC